ncbi:hypothetical protein [Arenicella xantha]|uniref:Uncharacterized protein n=1 Tax=Arenicella xantha TaxID=644221 RepID=A0A395JPD2_9GAMM|nr:hypothetical protein [Arenicella xantha]RBP53494.1 hypothetical protein DFR28_101880 [Arenicella xantha]
MNEQLDAQRSRRKVLLGLGTGAAVVVWHKPVINSVVMPAHAQTSVVEPHVEPPLPTPAELCGAVVTGNVVFGPVSGTTTPAVCSATFDVLSADPTNSLTIISIEAASLPADTTIDVQDLGVATNTAGPRVVWRGPATDAPFCTDLQPIEDVTFTITATCEAADTTDTDGDSFTQEFTLTSILADS